MQCGATRYFAGDNVAKKMRDMHEASKFGHALSSAKAIPPPRHYRSHERLLTANVLPQTVTNALLGKKAPAPPMTETRRPHRNERQ